MQLYYTLLFVHVGLVAVKFYKIMWSLYVTWCSFTISRIHGNGNRKEFLKIPYGMECHCFHPPSSQITMV